MKMKDYNGLLKKFWAGNATELEKLQLYKHIIEQEENGRTAPDQNLNLIEENEVLDTNDSQKILASLHSAINSTGPHYNIHSRNKIFRLFKTAAAVAAILVAIVLVVKWPFHTRTNSLVKKETTSSEKTISNNLSHIMMVKLADSSLVSIYPGSSISYQDTFNTGGERIIQLKGKANFKVQHNASKPFRVITSQIMTTDIGTVFSIDALQPNIIKVKLEEGSIKVEGVPGSNMAMNRKMQQPGEELNINLVTRQIIAVEPFKNTVAAANTIATEKRGLPAKQRLSFNRTPLAEVITRLSQREQVTIKFNRVDIEGLTFTGNIEPKDPLDLSLNILCSLNGLSYTKTVRGIEITKNK